MIFGSIPFVPSLIGMGIGYGAGELISLSVNRKRSTGAGLDCRKLGDRGFFELLGGATPFNFGIFGLVMNCCRRPHRGAKSPASSRHSVVMASVMTSDSNPRRLQVRPEAPPELGVIGTLQPECYLSTGSISISGRVEVIQRLRSDIPRYAAAEEFVAQQRLSSWAGPLTVFPPLPGIRGVIKETLVGKGRYHPVNYIGSMMTLEPAADLFGAARTGCQETKRGITGGIIVSILIDAGPLLVHASGRLIRLLVQVPYIAEPRQADALGYSSFSRSDRGVIAYSEVSGDSAFSLACCAGDCPLIRASIESAISGC